MASEILACGLVVAQQALHNTFLLHAESPLCTAYQLREADRCVTVTSCRCCAAGREHNAATAPARPEAAGVNTVAGAGLPPIQYGQFRRHFAILPRNYSNLVFLRTYCFTYFKIPSVKNSPDYIKKKKYISKNLPRRRKRRRMQRSWWCACFAEMRSPQTSSCSTSSSTTLSKRTISKRRCWPIILCSAQHTGIITVKN